MKQSSKRLVSIIGSLLLVVVALVLFFDVVEPEYGTVEQVKGQLVAENQLFQNETQAVATAQKVISQYQQDSQAQQSVALALPSNQDIAGAIAQIYGLAQSNNLVVQGIAVSVPTIQAKQGGSTGTSGGTSGTSQPSTVKPLGSFSLQVAAAGSYEGLQNFITGLETNIRVFDVEGLSVAPAQTGAAGANRDFFTFNVTVVTYYQTQ